MHRDPQLQPAAPVNEEDVTYSYYQMFIPVYMFIGLVRVCSC